MRILRVDIENYNTVGRVGINFAECPAVTMLSGRTTSAGASSNGTGKSSVLSAITWATFGRELRKRPAGNVIRRGESACRVEVVYELDDGKTLKIERTRRKSGGSRVRVNGKDASTATGGQDVIEARLGFSYDLFVRTVVFGGDISAFCRMTAAQRTQMLEEMLGIQHYLDGAGVAKEKANDLEDRHTELTKRRADREDSRNRAAEDMRACMAMVCENRARYETEIAAYRREVAKRTSELQETLLVYSDKTDEIEAKAGEYRDARARWESRAESLRQDIQTASELAGEARGKLAAIEGQVATASANLSRMEKGTKPKFCPTCGQPWGAMCKPVDLSAQYAEMKALRETLAKRRDAFGEKSKSLRDLQDAHRVLSQEEPVPPDRSPELRDLQSAIHEQQADLRSTMRVLQEMLANGDRCDGYRQAFCKALDRWLGIDEEEASEEEELNNLDRGISLYRYWQQGMSRDGIPSLLLDAVAPSLNRYAKPLADILTDGAYSFNFDNVVSDSGRTDFRVNVSNIDGGDSYEDLSKGELTRTDLCVLFAIRELMQDKARVRCDQIFVDELLDGLDQTGMEYAVRLLRSRKLAKQVIFISHHPQLQDAADGVVMLEKVGGVTQLAKE